MHQCHPHVLHQHWSGFAAASGFVPREVARGEECHQLEDDLQHMEKASPAPSGN